MAIGVPLTQGFAFGLCVRPVQRGFLGKCRSKLETANATLTVTAFCLGDYFAPI